jgi:hypothetical protein
LVTIIGMYSNCPEGGQIGDTQRMWFISELKAAVPAAPQSPPAGVSSVATKNPAQGIGFGRRLSGVPKSLGGPWLTVWEVRPRALSTLRCSLTRCKQMAWIAPDRLPAFSRAQEGGRGRGGRSIR